MVDTDVTILRHTGHLCSPGNRIMASAQREHAHTCAQGTNRVCLVFSRQMMHVRVLSTSSSSMLAPAPAPVAVIPCEKEGYMTFQSICNFNRCHFNRSQFQPIAFSTVRNFDLTLFWLLNLNSVALLFQYNNY